VHQSSSVERAAVCFYYAVTAADFKPL